MCNMYNSLLLLLLLFIWQRKTLQVSVTIVQNQTYQPLERQGQKKLTKLLWHKASCPNSNG